VAVFLPRLVRELALVLVCVVVTPIAIGAQGEVPAGVAPQASSASSSRQGDTGAFPQLPLKRDSDSDSSLASSMGWAVVFLAVLAGVGFVLVQRKTGISPKGRWNWPHRAPDSAALTVLERSALTSQASLHVVRWNAEELLLGCTPNEITLLARRPVGELQGAEIKGAAKVQK
jgi:hypothetical protein